jgi:hypothetical protein
MGKRFFLAAATLLMLSVFAVSAAPAGAANTVAVDCAADPNALATALASPTLTDGTTLAITGTCTGTFELTHTLTLTGSGGAELNGHEAGTVLKVDSGNTVTVIGLTITGGAAFEGGGIDNEGTLTVSQGTISGDTAVFAGGIANRAVLTLENTVVSGNGFSLDTGAGAGVLNRGSATVNNSTISGNGNPEGPVHPAFGGGIYNLEGTLKLTNSTVSGNSAGFGGGLRSSAPATVINSTISDNTAPEGAGGGIDSEALLNVDASTISGNSAPVAGGVDVVGRLTFTNTILAGQKSGGNCGFGTLIDAGYNLDDDGTCGLSSSNHSLPNTNPLLDPAGLHENGGPTRTIALVPGSPAIDAIPPGVSGCGTSITTDQRGVSRPQGSGCDIGAFEVVTPKPTSLATSLSGGGQSGPKITVQEGTAVTDQVTVSGENAANATGTVEYKVYSDNECKALAAAAGTVSASEGKVPPSESETLPAGTYHWQASYSGDTTNQRSTSACGVEVETVAKRTPTNKEQCKKGGWRELADRNGTPFKNQGDCVSFVATGGKKHAG